MSRQNSMSYPGQGRVKDPQLPKDPDGGRQGQGRAAQSEPNGDRDLEFNQSPEAALGD